MPIGSVKMLAAGFGFIEPEKGGGDLFFHESDLVGLKFSDQLLSQIVEFEVDDTKKFPRAINVRAAKV